MSTNKNNTLIRVLLIWFITIILLMIIFITSYSLYKKPVTYTGFKSVIDGDIIFNSSDPSSFEKYTNQLDNFFKPYDNQTPGVGNVVNCYKEIRKEDEVCHFEKLWLNPCGPGNWGYDKGEPCVLLTYNNDPTYQPIPYESKDEIPLQAPNVFKEIIELEETDGGSFDPSFVRLYCTNVEYYDYFPIGFDSFFFPNLNVKGYLPPIAAVKFRFQDDDGDIKPGEYNVECSLWSKNPNVNRVKKVKFKIKQEGGKV